MRRFMSFMSGLFSGAIVGGLVALLMAPASGHQLRGDLQDRVDGLLGDLRSAVEQERERLEAELESLKHGEIQIS